MVPLTMCSTPPTLWRLRHRSDRSDRLDPKMFERVKSGPEAAAGSCTIEVKPRGLSHSCDRGRGLRYHRCRRPGLNLYYVPVNYIIRPVSERYAQNAGAVFSLKYHLVWCPKYHRPVLVKPVDRRRK